MRMQKLRRDRERRFPPLKRRDREDLKWVDIHSVTTNPPCSPFAKGGNLLPPCAPISRPSLRIRKIREWRVHYTYLHLVMRTMPTMVSRIAACKKLGTAKKDGSLLCKRRGREDLKWVDIRSVTTNPPCSPFAKGGNLLTPCAPINSLSLRMMPNLFSFS